MQMKADSFWMKTTSNQRRRAEDAAIERAYRSEHGGKMAGEQLEGLNIFGSVIDCRTLRVVNPSKYDRPFCESFIT